MIGMARENRAGAIDLFDQHRARQEMRPGLRAEREPLVGAGTKRGSKPVRTAYEKDNISHAGIAKLRQMFREGLAGHAAPRLIQRNTMRTRRNFRAELCCFIIQARFDASPARGFNRDDFYFADAEFGRKRTGAFPIEIAKLLFGRRANLAHSRDCKAQR